MVHKSNSANGRACHVASLLSFVFVCGSSFFLVLSPIGTFYLTPSLIAPGDGSYLDAAIRMLALTAGPVIGTYLEMSRGGQGIKGGVMGGGLTYGIYVAFIDLFFPSHDPFSLGTAGDILVFGLTGAFHGLILGSTAFALSSAFRWSRRRTGRIAAEVDDESRPAS